MSHSILKKGFTLVELMVVITITAVLVSIGFSAYAKARERQMSQAISEQVITTLVENQKIASIGKEDCTSKYSGQKVTFSGTNTITTQSICETPPNGATSSQNITDMISITPATLIFEPLSNGIDLGGPTEINIDFVTSAQITYRIKVTNTGIIEYLGIQ